MGFSSCIKRVLLFVVNFIKAPALNHDLLVIFLGIFAYACAFRGFGAAAIALEHGMKFQSIYIIHGRQGNNIIYGGIIRLAKPTCVYTYTYLYCARCNF